MAGLDYAKIGRQAAGVMRKVKQGTIKLIVQGVQTGPAHSPIPGARTERTLDATAAGVPTRFIERGLAIEGDLQVISAVIEGVAEPKPGDQLSIDGIVWRVVGYPPAPAAGDKVVWKFIVRRG